MRNTLPQSMRRIFILAALSLASATSFLPTKGLALTSVNQPWLDTRTNVTWIYVGMKTFAQAASSCSLHGGTFPSFQDVATGIQNGMASHNNRNWVTGDINPLEAGTQSIWVNNPSSNPNTAYVILISGNDDEQSQQLQNHVVCMMGSVVTPPSPPPPAESLWCCPVTCRVTCGGSSEFRNNQYPWFTLEQCRLQANNACFGAPSDGCSFQLVSRDTPFEVPESTRTCY